MSRSGCRKMNTSEATLGDAIGVSLFGTLTVLKALIVFRPLPLLEGRMRDQSRMSVAVTATLLALSSSPSPGWADVQIAQSTAPTLETPRDSPGTGSSEPPSAEVLDPLMVQAVLGREVRSVADEDMGRIVDIIVDRSGQVRAGVIDFGGFLGVGSRKIAVDWSILRFGPGEKPDRIVVDLTRAQVKAAPEYKDGKPVVVLGASAVMPLAGPAPASPQ
jgi:PRC-barrel domain protein